jgi:hypothetical protein
MRRLDASPAILDRIGGRDDRVAARFAHICSGVDRVAVGFAQTVVEVAHTPSESARVPDDSDCKSSKLDHVAVALGGWPVDQVRMFASPGQLAVEEHSLSQEAETECFL